MPGRLMPLCMPLCVWQLPALPEKRRSQEGEVMGNVIFEVNCRATLGPEIGKSTHIIYPAPEVCTEVFKKKIWFQKKCWSNFWANLYVKGLQLSAYKQKVSLWSLLFVCQITKHTGNFLSLWSGTDAQQQNLYVNVIARSNSYTDLMKTQHIIKLNLLCMLSSQAIFK